MLKDVHSFFGSTNLALTIAVPVVKALFFLSSVSAIGFLFGAAFLTADLKGRLSNKGARLYRYALIATLILFISTIASFFINLANLLGGGVFDGINAKLDWQFLRTTVPGHVAIAQLLFVLLAIFAIVRSRRISAVVWALVLDLLATLVPVFFSHAGSGLHSQLAMGALAFHVIFLLLWMGGVIALAVIDGEDRARYLARFSAFALWAAIIVIASGAMAALAKVRTWHGWQSQYGLLLVLKIALTIILIAIGARHRKYLSAKRYENVLPLLLNEVVVMVVVLSLGAWLSTLQPPIDPNLASLQDNRQLITGVPLPVAPHWPRVLAAFNIDGAFFGLLLLFAALYLRAIWQLKRRGDAWPIGRTMAFFAGELAALFATSGGLGVYSRYSFALHMMAHMVLGMIAPIGFVLSAPLTLALRALPSSESDHVIRNLIVGALHSRVMKFYVNPIVALAIFDGSLFVLYMTPLFGNLMNSHNGHLVMDLHFLLAGYLFFYVIIGVDPSPRKIPHIVRIILLFAAMSIHALFSIALLSTTSLIDGGYYQQLDVPWNTDLLYAQHAGGAIGWAMGEVPILLALVATFIQWMRDDKRETKRIDRAAERAAAMGEDDDLAQYNKYLSALARHDTQQDDRAES